MTVLLTTDELRRHIETDIDDDILQQHIDAADEEINKRYGPHTDVNRTDRLVGTGSRYITLRHPAETILSVTEDENGVTTVLATDDYAQRSAMVLERLADGTNPRLVWPGQNIDVEGFSPSWSNAVIVNYTPKNYANRRRLVLIDLCKLSLAFSGVRMQGIGDFRETEILDPEMRREEILQRLLIRNVPFA